MESVNKQREEKEKMSMYKILIPMGCPVEAQEWLREKGYQVDVLPDCSVESICAAVGDYDGILARSNPYPAEVFAAAKKLKVLACMSTGTDHVDLKAAAAHGVTVTNTNSLNANAVAEHTMALVLACARSLCRMDRACREGDFGIRNRVQGHDLAGKTLGIVGYGSIGKLVAKKAALGFDMNVLAFNRHIGQTELPEYVKPATFDTVLRQADYLCIHVPGGSQTQGMIGEVQLSKMKPGAVLVNVARGSVVDQKALVKALQDGRLAGAGLDVYDPEPPEKENPLFAMENVVCTPHNASLTVETAAKMALGAAACLDDVLNGRPTAWTVTAPKR